MRRADRIPALRAFRHRNFRLFYAGQAISLIGTWVQQIALSWLVYRTTGSGLLLGLVAFCSQVPLLLFTPFAGLLSDRFDRRRIMIVAHTLASLQALTLGILALTGTLRPWQVLTLGFLYGVVMAFETPARQSLISRMVASRDDLPNAIALNSFLMNSGRLVGPSIAGVLLTVVSEGWCFLINAASFGAVIAATVLMHIEPSPAVLPGSTLLGDLTAALRYAWRTRAIRALLLLVALISLTASPYTVLMPIFARDVFHGDAHTLGFLVGAAGLGAVVGTAYLALRAEVASLGRIAPVTACVAGTALILVGLSQVYALSLFLMAGLGFGIIVTAASATMMLQTVVAENLRGRIISFYATAFLGLAPVGGLLAGALAGRFGAPATAMLCGAGCLAGLALLWKSLRSIHVDWAKSIA
jgi:MFS family permease